MVVPLSEEEATGFINDGTDYMQVRFTRDDTKTWAKFSIVYVGSTPCAGWILIRPWFVLQTFVI